MYVMKSSNIFLLLVLLFVTYTKQSNVVNIGAIFDDEDTDDEVAFRQAIRKTNQDNSIVHINPISKKVADGDPYKVGKLVCLMIEQNKGISAIIGPELETSIAIVESISNTLQIPHIQTNWMSNPKLNSLTVNLYPERSSLADAIKDIVLEFNWSSFTILFEDDEGLLRLEEVLELDQSDISSYTVNRVGGDNDDDDDDDDYKEILTEIKEDGETNIIIDCDEDSIIEILKVAKELGMLDHEYNFFFTALDAHTLDYEEVDDGEANIFTISLLDANETQELDEALMYDAIELFEIAFEKFNSTKHVNTAFTKNCDDDYPDKAWMYGRELYSDMIETEFDGISGMVEFDEHGRRTNFTLRVLELEDDEFVERFSWNDGEVVRTDDVVIANMDKPDFENKTLIVSSKIGAPYLMVDDDEGEDDQDGSDKYEGFVVDLLDEMAEILNFNYKIVPVTDGRYGSYDKRTKKWNGMIQDLIEKRADMIVSDLTITKERQKVVDFTSPFLTVGIGVLYKKTNYAPPELNMFTFVQPFSNDLWLCIGIAYVIVSIMVCFISRMTPDDWKTPVGPVGKNCEFLDNEWSLKNSFWLTLSAITIQGCNVLPKGISTRFIVGVWWIFSIIIAAYYIASVTTLLTLRHVNDHSIPRSIEDLAKKTDITFGAVKGGSTSSFFKHSDVLLHKNIWNSMEASTKSFVSSNFEGVLSVLIENGNYAYFMESTSLEYAMERNCDLTQIGGLLSFNGFGIAVPEDSPYTSVLNDAILQLKNNGKIQQIKHKWWKEEGGNNCADDDGHTPLHFDNIFGVFIALGLGVLIAFLLAIAEMLCKVNRAALKENIYFSAALGDEIRFLLNFMERRRNE